MSTPTDPTAKFDKFRRQLILKSKPVGKEDRAEWFERFSSLVEKAFPAQECRINRPGVAHRMFAAEVAIPRMKPESLIDFVREFEQLFLEAMPVTAERLFTNAYQDRMDVVWEAAIDLGDSYLTLGLKLRNAEFGYNEFNVDDRAGRGSNPPRRYEGDRPYEDRPRRNYDDRDSDRGGYRGDRGDRGSYGDRNRNDSDPRGPKPRRFDSDGNQKSGDDRRGPRPFNRNRFGDRDRPFSDRDRPYGNRENRDRPSGDRDNRDRPYGNRGNQDRPYGGRDNRDRPYGNRDNQDRPRGGGYGDDRPRGGGYQGNRDGNRGDNRGRSDNRGPDRRGGDSGSGFKKPFSGGGGKSFGKGKGPSHFKGKRNGPGRDKPKS